MGEGLVFPNMTFSDEKTRLRKQVSDLTSFCKKLEEDYSRIVVEHETILRHVTEERNVFQEENTKLKEELIKIKNQEGKV